MARILKKLAALLPHRWQQGLRRMQFRRQIERGTFRTPEPEWDAVKDWLRPGDCAIDVGANVGHYTQRFSQLVGPGGRVIAFEPVIDTFEVLASNVACFRDANVTLLNAGASDTTQFLGIAIPRFDSGLVNYYEAALNDSKGGLQVMTLSIDTLDLPCRVQLVKIDAEGHDLKVLLGARQLIARDRPMLIVETGSDEMLAALAELGYATQKLDNSPNLICRPRD